MKEMINKILAQIKNLTAKNPALHPNPVFAKNFQTIENRLRGAIQFLKKKSITLNGKKTSLNRLPWYLLIGNTGAGKTTLLANSGIKFILDKKIKAEDIRAMKPTENHDVWITPNAVLLDVPGNYFAHPEKKGSSNKLWQYFIARVQKMRGSHALSGVVITLSLAELMEKLSREQLVESLGHRISELQEKFGSHLPFYFTISKCDLMPGFAEFFSDSGSDELSQAWGVALPRLGRDESTIETFSDRFNALIKRLNKQLIWRLHQERSPFAKLSIKDFPLHVERFKEEFSDLLKRLARDQVFFYLRGVYLTSAIQHPVLAQSTQQPQVVSANRFQHALAIMQAPTMPGHAYFVRHLLLQGLTPAEAPVKPHNGWQRRNIAAALLMSTIILSLIFHGNNPTRENPVMRVAATVPVPKPTVVAKKKHDTAKDYDSFAMDAI